MVCGIAVLAFPLHRGSMWLAIPQIIVSLVFFWHSAQLFSTWKDKKIKYGILLAKNKEGFRPETFKIFMQAPCGRLLVKSVLKDLDIKRKYKELLVYKEPFFVALKNGCKPIQTKIYIKEVNA